MLRRFEALVFGVAMHAPAVPVIDNVTARPLRSADELRRSLVLQVTAPVLFEESLGWLHASGVRRYVQCGPGGALLGFAKRVAKGARFEAFEDAVGESGGG
jgi:[acyl-carrier-protein] S-malonyltransferase